MVRLQLVAATVRGRPVSGAMLIAASRRPGIDDLGPGGCANVNMFVT